MKILHIEGKSTETITLTDDALTSIESQKGKNLGLCTTIQFIESIPKIKKQIESKDVTVVLLKGKHSSKEGQILGCDVPLVERLDAVLFIGDGLFHPKAMFLKNNLPVFAYNPYTKKISEITKEDVETFEKFRKIGLVKFHSSENIGVIVSTKPGQRVSDKKLEELESKFKEKQFYKFIADTIDFSQLENFPFIECWVNTACPRIGYDDSKEIGKAIINIDDLEL